MSTSAYKSALLPLLSYPQPTLPAAITTAVETAAALDLRLVGLALEIEPPPSVGLSGYSMPFVGATIDVEDAKTRVSADAIAQEFEAQTRLRGVRSDLQRVTCDALDASGIVAQAARLCDLTIVTLAPQSRADRELAEAALFGAGRPALLLPLYYPAPITAFDRVVVAWDASRAAARALSDSMPLLRRANDVFVVTLAREGTHVAQTLIHVERQLKEHGVSANCTRIDDSAGSDYGAILGHAKSVNANLLVMGAFGHSRMRDFILGGVTQSVLADLTIPVLLSH